MLQIFKGKLDRSIRLPLASHVLRKTQQIDVSIGVLRISVYTYFEVPPTRKHCLAGRLSLLAGPTVDDASGSLVESEYRLSIDHKE